MAADDKVNILLVDDQPAKLLSYETILGELGENLIKTASARASCLISNPLSLTVSAWFTPGTVPGSPR